MVHRTTFYKHYADKFDLLQQGVHQMYDALVGGEEHLPPSAYSAEHPPTYFVRLFDHAAKYRGFYQAMLCGEGVGRFQKLVKDYIVDAATTKMRQLLAADRRRDVPAAIHAHFVAGAALSLLTWWLENDMPLSPHQMAQYLMSPHGISPSAS